MIRAVIDTNVLVSSFLRLTSNPTAIRRAWQRGAFELCISHSLLGELRDVLRRPVIARTVKVGPEEISAFLSQVEERASFASDPLEVAPVVAADPDDDIVVATALATEADAIVSGDNDLLALKQHRGIAIISPREFVRLLRESARG
jgi:hypothetical protein